MKMTWTKESALAELRALAEEARALEGQPRFSEQHTRWLTRVLAVLEEVFGRQSRYYLSFAGLEWGETDAVFFGGPGDPEGSWNPAKTIARRHQQAYVRDLGAARGFLLGAADHLERADLTSVYEGKDTPPESSTIIRVIKAAEGKLRKVIRTTPKNEKEVQEAFENLLVGADIPYSREADHVEYSSKTYVPDFTLPAIDLAIDLKLCAAAGREKEIIAEINDDILAYRTKYSNLLFIVYDVGQIRDVDRFTASFEQHENVIVRVVKQ